MVHNQQARDNSAKSLRYERFRHHNPCPSLVKDGVRPATWKRSLQKWELQSPFVLQAPRPATGVSRGVSGTLRAPGSRVSRKCPESAPRMSKRCPEHSGDTLRILRRPGPEGPGRHPEGHSLDTSLIFFSFLFWEKARKTHQKARIFCLFRTPRILVKEGKNTQKRKESLEKQISKEIQKSKEKKIRVWARRARETPVAGRGGFATFVKSFCGQQTLWDLSLPVCPHTLGYACTLYAPTSPLFQTIWARLRGRNKGDRDR